MGIRFGPFDSLQLIFEVMNALMRKGLISYEESREIIRKSLPPEMTEEQKEKVLNNLIKKAKKR